MSGNSRTGAVARPLVRGGLLCLGSEFSPTGFTLPTDIAVDSAGDSYVAANDLASGTGYLLKYSPAGAQIGRQVAPNQGSPWFPVLNRLAYDPATGHLYVVENYLDAATGAPSALLIEYDAGLNLVSTPQIVPPALLGKPGALVADKSGNVYVGGWQTVFSASPFYSDFAAVEFSPHLARQSPPQTIHTFNAGIARLFGAAVDGAGRVYGAGDLRDASTNWNTAGVVVQSGGYARTFQAPGSLEDLFVGVTADAAGDAYVAASSLLPSVVAFQVQKYDPTGTLLWSVSPFEGLSFGDVIKLDAQNNVYAVSSSGVAKYSQGGAQPALSIAAGDAQIGIVNQPLSTPLTVIATTTAGAAAGVPVNFAVTVPTSPAGQSLSASSATTAADGRASTVLTLGSLPADYAVTATCPNCASAANSVTFHACGKLPNDNFQQAAAPWGPTNYDRECRVVATGQRVECDPSNPPPGTSPVTIGAAGCALSSLATVNNFYHATVNVVIPSTDPGSLNVFLDSPTVNGYQGAGAIVWGRIEQFSGNQIGYIGATDIGGGNSQANVLQTADTDILAGRPVIFRVRHVLANGTVSSHFVTAVGKCGTQYIISDPAGTRTLYDPSASDFQFRGIRRFGP